MADIVVYLYKPAFRRFYETVMLAREDRAMRSQVNLTMRSPLPRDTAVGDRLYIIAHGRMQGWLTINEITILREYLPGDEIRYIKRYQTLPKRYQREGYRQHVKERRMEDARLVKPRPTTVLALDHVFHAATVRHRQPDDRTVYCHIRSFIGFRRMRFSRDELLDYPTSIDQQPTPRRSWEERQQQRINAEQKRQLQEIKRSANRDVREARARAKAEREWQRELARLERL